MGLCMSGGGQFVDRNTVALVETPVGTDSWKPVPHIDVIDAVTEVVKAHDWQIVNEKYGLAHDGQKLFGVVDRNVEVFRRNGVADLAGVVRVLRQNERAEIFQALPRQVASAELSEHDVQLADNSV